MRKQELARQTRAARLDPVVGALLDDTFARLGLLDPERHLRDAIACYPRDATVEAAGTLADRVDSGRCAPGQRLAVAAEHPSTESNPPRRAASS